MEKLREMEVARQEMKRQAFEEAFQGKLGAHICQFDLDDDGNYEDRETLSGWEMWQAAQEQMLREQAEEAAQPNAFLSAVADMTMKLSSGDYALVPKEPTQDMVVNALAVIATGISERSIDEEIHMLWGKMLEAANQ